MRGREKIKKYRFVIDSVTRIYSLFPDKFQEKLLAKNRSKKGKIGMLKRYCLVKNLANRVGENVSIHPDVYLFNIKNLSIGNNVSIHPMTYIEAYGGVEIGNDVSIAHGVTIMSASHQYSDCVIPIKDQEVVGKKITIENNVWIGAKATILYGRTIKRGSIVGANCLVARDVLENEIVGGVPNKTIKIRGDK